MTFDPNVPNASQSPGLFPPQNGTNFSRLKTIIDVDHVFSDASTGGEGFHKQCTMIARAIPSGVIPGGANSILYTFVDSFGQAQLGFYNGTDNFILTPPETLYPIRVVGTQSVTSGTTVTVYADPGFSYAGTGWAAVNGANIFRFYSMLRMGVNDIHELDSNQGGISRPTLSFSGNNLRITNNDASTRTLAWSLIINRIS